MTTSKILDSLEMYWKYYSFMEWKSFSSLFSIFISSANCSCYRCSCDFSSFIARMKSSCSFDGVPSMSFSNLFLELYSYGAY
jgi:hypothetical protein